MTYLLISIIIAIFSLIKLRKYKVSGLNRLFLSLFILILLISNLFFLIADHITGQGIDESVYYYLNSGLDGAGFGQFLHLMIITPIILIVGLITAHLLLGKSKPNKENKSIKALIVTYLLLICSVIISPGVSTTIARFVPTENNNSDFYTNFPSQLNQPSPQNKKNIVYIYLESLERTYFDQDEFPGLTKELIKLESISTSFTNIYDVLGTGWTIGGTVGSQCGIPLSSPTKHDIISTGMDSFLIGANCIGDILKEEGYNLQFYGGADLAFGNKGKFYSDHGFEPHGKNEILKLLNKDVNLSSWGIYDDTLLDLANAEFTKLSEDQKPFGLFLLTLDTHHPDGMRTPSCENIKYNDGQNPILNAVACSDFLVGNYVNSILNSKYADNTIIVISSDHRAMINTASDKLKKLERRDLFMIIDPTDKKGTKISKMGSMFDIGPTVLHKLGYSANIGFGKNLFLESSRFNNLEEFNALVYSWIPSISKLWKFPKIDNNIVINPSKKILTIENREFPLPIVIEIDKNNETLFAFDYDKRAGGQKSIAQNATKDSSVIWIDTCIQMPGIDPTVVSNNQYCLYIKRNDGEVIATDEISGETTIPEEYINQILNTSL